MNNIDLRIRPYGGFYILGKYPACLYQENKIGFWGKNLYREKRVGWGSQEKEWVGVFTKKLYISIECVPTIQKVVGCFQDF